MALPWSLSWDKTEIEEFDGGGGTQGGGYGCQNLFFHGDQFNILYPANFPHHRFSGL